MRQNAPKFEKFERLALAIIECPTVDGAAQRAGVSRSTVHRHLRNEFFLKVLDLIRRQVHAEALAVLSGMALEAARQLVQLARDPTAPASVRLAACREILAAGRQRLLPEKDRSDALEAIRSASALLGEDQL
jgi:AcrR family transcriptional regulator